MTSTTETIPASLKLDGRGGLPDELAHLRAAYPRGEWRAHINFGDLSAFWLQTHELLRNQGSELNETLIAFRQGGLDAIGFQRFFAPRLNRFLQHLDGHHQIEDAVYFPKFRALEQRMVAGFDLLENDHAVIHEALLRSARSAQEFLVSFQRGQDAWRGAADTYAADSERLLALLLRHLADEEDLIVPAMLHHGERTISVD